MKKLSFSLLIPTLNRPDYLKRILGTISNQTRKPDEVVIIDQSDGPESREVFEQWNPPEIRKVYVHRKVKSLILARHQGIDVSGQVDLVAFFDDDIVPRVNFCEELVSVFERDPERRFAGGMGTIEGSRFRLRPFQRFFMMPREGSGNFLPGGSPTFPHWKNQFCETEFLSGGLTFWRKDVISQFRFDERLAGYGHGDDVDVSYRISRQWKLFYQPSAICSHEEHSPGRDGGYRYRRAWIQNFYYLAQKNGLSIGAYGWSVFGYFLRDLICLDGPRLKGDFEGIRSVLRQKIDTVIGYDEFIAARQEQTPGKT